MNTEIINLQYQAEEVMLDKFHAGNYTIENPLIVMDPYKLNPLSAYICFRTEDKTAITVNVRGRKKRSDIVQSFPMNKEHILPIYGLYLNQKTRVEISYYQGKSIIHELEVKDVDFDEDLILDFEADPLVLENQLLIYSTPTTFFKYHLPVGIDCLGDIRWLLTTPFNWDFRMLKNGHIMVGSGDTLLKPYHVSGLYEIDWMGKIHTFYQLDSLYHHDFLEIGDNELLVLTNSPDFEHVEDELAVFNRDTGKITKRFNYTEIFDPKRIRKSGSWSEHDWCHNNSVWYDKYTNSLTLSGRHMDTIFNVDYDTFELNWILSDPKGWDQEYVDKYFLKPIGYNFEYTYGQHAVSFNSKGDLLCFDNHYKGKKHPDYVVPEKSYSRGVRFKINTEEKTIQTEWTFGKDLGTLVYSPYISFVESYHDEHNLIHFGGISLENGKASHFHGPSGHERDIDMESETFEFAYGRQLLRIRLKGNYYRARKINYLLDDYQFKHKTAKLVKVQN